MPNFIQKLFTNPEMFRRIRPDLFLAWLKQSENYFTKHGVIIPADSSGFERSAFNPGFDYEWLVRVFMEPTADMPAGLIEGLHLVHEMGRPAHVESMFEEARKFGLDLGLGDDAPPEDVALKLLLLDPRVLQNLQNCGVIKRRRGFEYFSSSAVVLPKFEGPTLEQIRILEARLGAFYAAWRCGTGTRVFSYCQQRLGNDFPEWFFLVWHGAIPKREEAMEKGEPTSVMFRPRRYAILKYDPLRGEMGVYCSAEREKNILLRVFGGTLFGRDNFFPARAKFNLRPLVDRGRLALGWADVPPIEDVRLTELEFFRRRAPWRRVIHQADDLFELFERGELHWPRDLTEVAKATFTVKFWRQRRPRQLTIVPCNRALYARDGDSPILAKWMEAREIIQPAIVLQA